MATTGKLEDEVTTVHMKMNLHAMSKTGFTLTLGLFLVAFVLSVVIGAFGPTVFEYTSGHTDGGAQSWNGSITHLSKLHQQLILTMALHNKEYQNVGFSQAIVLNISVEGRPTEDSSWQPLEMGNTHSRDITCDQGEPLCRSIIVAHEGYIDYWAYRYSINIVGSKQDLIGNATFTFSYVNDAFTLFELWFRLAFLCFTFIVIVIFFVKLRPHPWHLWSVEQKWTSVLLFGLLAYNDPFFPLTIIVSGWFPQFLDIVLFFTFIIMLFFFWLVMFDGIRLEESERTFVKFYLPKIVLLGCFWVGSVTGFTMLALQELDDPSVILEGQTYYLIIQIIVLVLLLLYVFWLAYSVIRAISTMSSMPFLTVRLKFFGLFTLIIFAITISGIVFGFVSPISLNAAQFLSFLSLFNLYVYTLAFVYLPSTKDTGVEDFSHRMGVERLEEDDTQLLMQAYTQEKSDIELDESAPPQTTGSLDRDPIRLESSSSSSSDDE